MIHLLKDHSLTSVRTVDKKKWYSRPSKREQKLVAPRFEFQNKYNLGVIRTCFYQLWAMVKMLRNIKEKSETMSQMN